jgi:surfactin synthase thioesterase subunit
MNIDKLDICDYCAVYGNPQAGGMCAAYREWRESACEQCAMVFINQRTEPENHVNTKPMRVPRM